MSRDRTYDFLYAAEATRVLHAPTRALETFGTTSVNYHLLAELDETDRKLLTAFSLEGKSTKQIAGEMNLTDGQVRVRLHRIRKKMKKGMKDDA